MVNTAFTFSVRWSSKVSYSIRLPHHHRLPRCACHTRNTCSLISWFLSLYDLTDHLKVNALLIPCSFKEEGYLISSGLKLLFLHWFCLPFQLKTNDSVTRTSQWAIGCLLTLITDKGYTVRIMFVHSVLLCFRDSVKPFPTLVTANHEAAFWLTADAK